MKKNNKGITLTISSGLDSLEKLMALISNSNLSPEHKELFSALCTMGSNLLQDIAILDKKIKKAEEESEKAQINSEDNLKEIIEKVVSDSTKVLVLKVEQNALRKQFVDIASIIGNHIKNLENNHGVEK